MLPAIKVLRHGDIGCVEHHVVGDQELTHAHGRGSGRLMQSRPSDIGAAAYVLGQAGSQGFELAPPDVLQPAALVDTRRITIEIYGNAEAVPQSVPDLEGDLNALLLRRTIQRHEGNHVQGTDARVHAPMLTKVDRVDGDLGRAQDALGDRVGWPYKGEYRAVVIDIRALVQQPHPADRDDCAPDPCDHRGVTTLGEVWYALDPVVAWHFV